MSISKDLIFEEMAKESMEARSCSTCGGKLTSEAVDAGQDQCFSCFEEHQG